MVKIHTSGYPDHRHYGSAKYTDLHKGEREAALKTDAQGNLIILAQSGAGYQIYKVKRKHVKKSNTQKDYDKYVFGKHR